MKRKPFIWLQENEVEGQAKCGCMVVNNPDGVRVYLCRTHGAAHRMLDALKEIGGLASFLIERQFDSRPRLERIAWSARWAEGLTRKKRRTQRRNSK